MVKSTNCEALHYVTSPLLGQNIFAITLFSNTRNQFFPLRQNFVSHTHKTTGYITVLYVLIHSYWHRRTNVGNGITHECTALSEQWTQNGAEYYEHPFLRNSSPFMFLLKFCRMFKK